MKARALKCGVVLLAAVASTANGQNQCSDDGGGGGCHLVEQYCDKFESKCRSCRELCTSKGKFAECEDKCETYLKEAIFSREEDLATKEDLKTLQILLGVVTAVTSVSLILLLVLLCLKCSGRKRTKREKEVFPMGDFHNNPPTPPYVQRPRSSTPNHSGHGQSYLERQIPSPPPPIPPATSSARSTTGLPNGLGRSLQTMTTQISEETNSSTLSRRHNHNSGNNGTRGSFQSTNNGNVGPNRFNSNYRSPPSRIPSEDRVPASTAASVSNGGYVNRGLDPGSGTQSPTTPTTQSTFPPVAAANARSPPYTISHTQVV